MYHIEYEKDSLSEESRPSFSSGEHAVAKPFLTDINYWLSLLAIALLPIMAVPIWDLSLDVVKKFWLTGTILLTLLVWATGLLRGGKSFLPKSPIFIALGSVLGVTLLSACLSPAVYNSLFGFGHEHDTFLSLLVMSLLVLIVAMFFQDKGKQLNLYIALSSVGLLAFVYQLYAIYLSGFVKFSLFPFKSISLISRSFYDFGIYFGLLTLICLVVLETLPAARSKIFRNLIIATLVVSMISVMAVNYLMIWIFLALFSLIIFVYSITFVERGLSTGEGLFNKNNLTKKIINPSFVVLAISCLMVLDGSYPWFSRVDANLNGPGGFISQSISAWQDSQGLNYPEVRPAFLGTRDVAISTLKENFLIGAGPNNFISQWARHKPVLVNQTNFWDVNFSSGFGLIPTTVVTSGLLGLLAWLFLLVTIFLSGIKFFFANLKQRVINPFFLIAMFGSFYLWLFAIFFTPGTTVWALSFVFTGLLIASMFAENDEQKITIGLSNDPRVSFSSTMILVLVIFGSLGSAYILTQKYWSIMLFQRGLHAYSQKGDLNLAEKHILSAINLNRDDVYYRALAELNLGKINQLLTSSNLTPEEVRESFNRHREVAVTSSLLAKNINPQNYLNWSTLALVYESLASLNFPNAYEQAVTAYATARQLNPTDPSLVFRQGRLELAKKDTAKAREYFNQALVLKPNYAQALFALAQLDANEGKIDQAIANLGQVAMLAPLDAGVHFQLGFLKYHQKSYPEAVIYLQKALSLDKNFDNAKYFLALSYDYLGQTDQAIELFGELVKTNPSNKEVQQILANLQAGRRALAGEPPITAPEKRETVPIDDDN